MTAKTINVITGPQGAGKTDKLREIASANPGLYLFACPTIELVEEQEARLQAEGKIPCIRSLHSGRKTKGKVFDQLTALKTEIETNYSHAVVFITHETLTGNSFDSFANWKVMIDEAPSTLHSGTVKTGVAYNLIRDMLAPQHSSNGWTHYKIPNGVNYASLKSGDLGAAARALLKEAARPMGVFVEDAATKVKQEFRWFSFWSPTYLDKCAEIYVSASNYQGSLGFRAMSYFFPQHFTVSGIPVSVARIAQPNIEIRYFADTHTGSTSFWDKNDGVDAIVELADYIASHTPDLDFWSANGTIEKRLKGRLGGEFIGPLAMGLNKFRTKSKCAFIYSAKYQPSDKPICDVTDITADDITDARETEAIRQFVMRGQIRNFDYGGDYLIYLYEKPQAERIQAHLSNNGFTNIVLTHAATPKISAMVRKIATLIEKSADEVEADQKAASALRSKKSDDKKFVERYARKAIAQGYNTFSDFTPAEKAGWQKRRNPLIKYIDKAIPVLRSGAPMPPLDKLG